MERAQKAVTFVLALLFVTAGGQRAALASLSPQQAELEVRAACAGEFAKKGKCGKCVDGVLKRLKKQKLIDGKLKAALKRDFKSECKGECIATSCAGEGANCGAIDDECGGRLECGSCPLLKVCGGGGQPNACGAVSLTVHGYVSSGGVPIVGAQVQVGTGATSAGTDGAGEFSVSLLSTELLARADGSIIPIRVSAAGYATAHHNEEYGAESDYRVEISTLPTTDEIAGDVSQGVSLMRGGERVGDLTIPAAAFPAGVTSVTGTATYYDPTTVAGRTAFPGTDFVGLPASPSPGNPIGLVLLESFGAMTIEVVDQLGRPVTTLAGRARLCVKVPGSLTVSAGEAIPLWYYDPSVGAWREEGGGVVEDRGGEGRFACGEVSHFTSWNYDRPLADSACFKFRFVDEASGLPIAGGTWYAEGVSYSGNSPERECDCDGDDPSPPCPGVKVASFTVMRSTLGSPQTIRVSRLIAGTVKYLVRNGDGTYNLTSSTGAATIFSTPQAAGSCFWNQAVENCRFLDEADPAGAPGTAKAGNNGILPLACAPITCAGAGKNCGVIPDGCAGTLSCGTCTAPLTCGGGGTSNVCGNCAPTTCASLGKDCGNISDGCSGRLECGTCTAPATCGGGGSANVCGDGCDPATLTAQINNSSALMQAHLANTAASRANGDANLYAAIGLAQSTCDCGSLTGSIPPMLAVDIAVQGSRESDLNDQMIAQYAFLAALLSTCGNPPDLINQLDATFALLLAQLHSEVAARIAADADLLNSLVLSRAICGC